MSGSEAVRAELHSVLHDLADALRAGRSREFLDQSIRHAMVLADLAGIKAGVVRSLLDSLQNDLRQREPIDAAYYASQLALAADRL